MSENKIEVSIVIEKEVVAELWMNSIPRIGEKVDINFNNIQGMFAVIDVITKIIEFSNNDIGSYVLIMLEKIR